MRSSVTIIESSDGETTSDLASLEVVKTALGITANDDDVSLAGQITRASKSLAELCGRVFQRQDVVETFRFGWRDRVECGRPLSLSRWPIIVVDSVSRNDVVVDVDDYDVDSEDGLLWLHAGVWSGNVVVTYSGGYDLPEDAPDLLQSAVIELVRDFRAGTDESQPIREIAHGDSRVSFFSGTQTGEIGTVSDTVDELIRSFKRVS